MRSVDEFQAWTVTRRAPWGLAPVKIATVFFTWSPSRIIGQVNLKVARTASRIISITVRGAVSIGE
jgi:hypothetical protein